MCVDEWVWPSTSLKVSVSLFSDHRMFFVDFYQALKHVNILLSLWIIQNKVGIRLARKQWPPVLEEQRDLSGPPPHAGYLEFLYTYLSPFVLNSTF